MQSTVPATTPHRVADDTWLITNLVPGGPGAYIAIAATLMQPAELQTAGS